MKYKVTEGAYATEIQAFDTMEEALEYIDNRFGADNTVEQLIQINTDETTYGYLEIYDMLTK